MKNKESFIMRTCKFTGALLLLALFAFVLAFIISYLVGDDILSESKQEEATQVNNI